MKNTAQVIFMVFVNFAIFASIITLLGLLLTRKFNQKLRKVYILFVGLSFREVFLLSTAFINLVLMIYFVCNTNSVVPIGLYIISPINFLSCLFSFNIRVIFIDIIYTIVSCSFLWLLMTIRNYYNYVGNNNYILILIILFTIMIIIYSLFITIRKINLLINMHETNGGKDGK